MGAGAAARRATLAMRRGRRLRAAARAVIAASRFCKAGSGELLVKSALSSDEELGNSSGHSEGSSDSDSRARRSLRRRHSGGARIRASAGAAKRGSRRTKSAGAMLDGGGATAAERGLLTRESLRRRGSANNIDGGNAFAAPRGGSCPPPGELVEAGPHSEFQAEVGVDVRDGRGASEGAAPLAPQNDDAIGHSDSAVNYDGSIASEAAATDAWDKHKRQQASTAASAAAHAEDFRLVDIQQEIQSSDDDHPHMLPYMGSSASEDGEDDEGARLLSRASNTSQEGAEAGVRAGDAGKNGWGNLRVFVPSALRFSLPPPRRPRPRLSGIRRLSRVASSTFIRGFERVGSASNAVGRGVAVVARSAASGAAHTKLLLWVAASTIFGLGMFLYKGPSSVAEYFAGYLVEQSLSVDNLFVFNLVFSYFRVPAFAQDKALAWGIVGAAIMRAIFIILGAALLQRFEWLLGIFALILVYSSIKLLFDDGGDDDDGDLSDNWTVKLCRKLIPVTDRYEGDNFISAQRSPTGRRRFTPLVLVVAVIEISDVVFAVDSIPAVFGITQDAFVVYTSNMFAILSLRALYAFVHHAVASARFLQPAVAITLFFIGVKMVLALADVVKVPVGASLGIVSAILGTGVALSVAFPAPLCDDATDPMSPPRGVHARSSAGQGSDSTDGRGHAQTLPCDEEQGMLGAMFSPPHPAGKALVTMPTLVESPSQEGISSSRSMGSRSGGGDSTLSPIASAAGDAHDGACSDEEERPNDS